MANRNRNNVKIEAIIESCRGEAKWQRVIELAEELKSTSPNNGDYTAAIAAIVIEPD